jgi:hypothetical protein
MKRSGSSRSFIERVAPFLDWAQLAIGVWAALAIYVAPSLPVSVRASRIMLECSAAFQCEFRVTMDTKGVTP